MAEITKPDLSALWASGGALVAPSNSKIQQGWTAEIPPHQWENFIQNRQDNAIAYLYQMGIAQWDNTTDYIANKSVVMHNGNIYTSIQNSKNVTPPNPTYWKLLLSLVTTTEHGLMSAQDKIKLNNLDTLLDTKADKSITITGVGALIGGGTLEGNRTIDASSSTKASLLRADNSVQANQVTQASGNSTTSVMSQKAVTDALNTKADSITLVTELNKKADNAITISAGTGLSGGGDLKANRTLAVSYGTTSGTAAQGNDSRIVNAVQTAGTGLTKSGTTLSVNYGTTSTTAARGDDSRITGAAQKSANLSDLTDIETARDNLGLGDSATQNVGTTSGTVAAGNDSRIVNAVQTSGNQTVAGIKTFSSFPVTPSAAPTANYQAANKKYVDDSAIGVGQTWQDVTSSRVAGTTYTNTTGRSIMILITIGTDARHNIYLNGVLVARPRSTDSGEECVSFVVPPGNTYSISLMPAVWAELR